MAPTFSLKIISGKYSVKTKTSLPCSVLPLEKTVENVGLRVPSENKLKSKTSCLANPFRDLRLEMVSFLFTFSHVLTKISSSAMILDKVCLAHFNYPVEVCDDLENYTEIKISVERMATDYQLGHTLIQTAPAALLSCFIGPWSDYYGRKLPILVATAGIILDTIGSTVCAYFLDSRVEYYFIPPLFTSFSGGTVALLAVVYSYASDMTSFEKRTMKYAYIEVATGFAMPLGMASGGWMYEFLGYPAVFLLSTAGLCCSFIWVVFLLPETRGLDNKDHWGVKVKELFKCTTFRESFIATAKKRPNKGRKQIILLIVSMIFLFIAITSTTDINYLYVHHRYDWGDTKYSNFTAIYSIISIVVLMTVFPLFSHFNVRDPALGLIGTTSTFLKFICIGFAYKTTVFHVANLFGVLSLCATLAARSRISKVVPNDDLGKVFSFVAISESLLPVMASVIVTQIFNAFLPIFPGAPYILLAILLIIPFSVFCWIASLPMLSKEDTQGDIGRTPECEKNTNS